MADSYHIIDGKVVPYSGGRRCNDTDAWRDATPLELQVQEQLEEYEHANAAQEAEIEALRAEVERSERYAEQSERERLWVEARAERLAEALRLAEEHLNDITPEWYSAGQRVLAKIRAALKQEEEK